LQRVSMSQIFEVKESNKLRLYEALGQIVISFKTLELAVEGIVFCTMQISASQARILMSSMSFAAKVSAMNSTVLELHGRDLGSLGITLNEFVERCLFCEQQRNLWIKSHWIPELSDEPGYIKRLKQVQSLNDSSGVALDSVSILELESFIACLNATVSYLYAFHQKLLTCFGRVRDTQALNDYLFVLIQAGNDA
jgi:hypothetical protein